MEAKVINENTDPTQNQQDRTNTIAAAVALSFKTTVPAEENQPLQALIKEAARNSTQNLNLL